MSRYIDADNAIERLGAYLMADAQIEYGGMASEDINDWKEIASDILKGTPSIDIEADYVPRDFHDKTCEAMAKRHQEEIANMVSVVRCKECASYCGDGNKCLWGLLAADMGYCHHGYRGGDCITDGRKENK